MNAVPAILLSFLICAVAATLEGVCAGKNVKPLFAKLRFPGYSAPLWIWTIIGAVYYLIFGFVLYRLLRLNISTLRLSALTLILFMMIANALTNYIIFRLENLRLSFFVGALFPLMDIALYLFLVRLDRVASWALVPYLIYRVYAVWWGYGLWKLNEQSTPQ